MKKTILRKVVSTLLATAMVMALAAIPAFASAQEEPTTIIQYNFGSETFIKNTGIGVEAVNELLLEYGIKLDLRLLSESEYVERMNLIINSNEYFDICFTSTWRLDFYQNVGKGAFLDLTDLIPEYAPKITEFIKPEYLAFGNVNGRLYAIPNLQILANPYGLYLRKDVADELGIDMTAIKTLDDLDPVFELIKSERPDLYPMGGGLDDRVWGSGDTVISFYGAIAEDDPDLNVVSYYTRPMYLNTNEYNLHLYNEGYIRPDIASVTTDQSQGDMVAGLYAGAFGDVKPGGEVEFKNRRGWDAYQIKISDAMMGYNSGAATMNAVSINTASPDKVMKYLELIHTDGKTLDALLYGTEGRDHVITPEGAVRIAENSPYFLGNTAWAFGNTFLLTVMEGQDPTLAERTEAVNDAAKRSPIVGFALNTEPIQSELAQLDALREEYKNRVYMPNYEELEAEYLSKVQLAGLDKVLAEMQAQVDAWAIANGKK
ncbi:MAG: extracellular solute-binding protein [Oscillospiraceae bacterium]|jgi:putative aldouronate transport system substrate-binding protein|nr:extracellular solute-binding protein [Oscillospiraceae bacterium]